MKSDINIESMTNFLDNYVEVVRGHFSDLNRMLGDRVNSLNQVYRERLNLIEEYKKLYLVEDGSGRINCNAVGIASSFSSKRKLYSYSDNEITKKLRSSVENLPVVPEHQSPNETENEEKAGKTSRGTSLDREDISESSNFDHKEARLKRNASKKAVESINKQVNQNLNSKLRRPNGSSELVEVILSNEGNESRQTRRSRQASQKPSDKENNSNTYNLSNHHYIVNNIKSEPEELPTNERNSIRRSTRKGSVAVISEGDCKIMPPPPAPVMRSKRTRTRAKKSTVSQPPTAVDSDSDGESGCTRKRVTRASKQSSNNSITDHFEYKDNLAIEKSDDIKLEMEDSKIMPPPLIVDKPVKLDHAKRSTHAESNKKESTVPSLENTDQNAKTNHIVVELNETNNMEPTQSETRPKRTKAKKHDQNNIEKNKTDDTEPSQSDARPKRTKAKKRTLQETQNEHNGNHSNVSNIGIDVVDLKQADSSTSEIVNDKRLGENVERAQETPEEAVQSEFEVLKDQRSKRTKARKLQKQQALDASSELTIKTPIREELTVQSLDDDNTYPEPATSRPKRTRKANKYAENQMSKESNKNESKSSEVTSVTVSQNKNDNLVSDSSADDKFYDAQSKDPSFVSSSSVTTSNKGLFNATVVLEKSSKIILAVSSNELEQHPHDKTYNVENLQVETKAKPAFNETIVLSGCTNDTNAPVLNQTIVLKKGQELNCNTSLLTDDNSEVEETPPKPFLHNKKNPTKHNNTVTKLCGSPVKQRVEQFERMAATNKAAATSNIPSAGTRNKANAKDSTTEAPISAKATRSNIVTNVETFLHNSGSKAAALTSAAGEEAKRRFEREQEAHHKKIALIEKKRLDQKIIREKKAAAAAASRIAAAKEKEQVNEAVRLKQEKVNQATAQRSEQRYQNKNKKRLEQERKALELEEKRKQEEETRQAKARELELENQRAAEEKRKQQEENDRRRKEALAKEKKMQLARQEFLAKEKEEKRLLSLQSKAKSKANTPLKGLPGFANTPLKGMSTSTLKSTMTSTALTDGFEYLDQNEGEDRPRHEVPQWSRSEHRNKVLYVQRYIKSSAIDRLFMVQRFNPKLEEIFPAIDKNLLKRSSSAVWKTPPRYSMMPNIY